MLTIPCPKVKSSTKDLSLPIFEVVIQFLWNFGIPHVTILWHLSVKDIFFLVEYWER